MNSKIEKLESELRPLKAGEVELRSVRKETDLGEGHVPVVKGALLPMILASGSIRHGIRELNSPLSE